MVGPDAKGEHPDGKRRVDDELEAKELAAGELRKDETHEPHRREHEDVHLRVTEEPEQVLPQHRAAVLDGKEHRAEVTVHQQHHECAPQKREREQNQRRLGQDGPREDVEIGPVDIVTALGEDGGDKVDRPHGRGDAGEVQAQKHQVDTRGGLLGRQWGVHRPGGLGSLDSPAGQRLEEKARPDEECTRGKEPERDGVDPGKRHVVGPDQQRDKVVREGRDDRRPEQKEEGDPVGGQQGVVEAVAEQGTLGRREVDPHQECHHAADDQRDDGVGAVQHPDVLVVDCREPAHDPAGFLAVGVAGLPGVSGTTPGERGVRPPVLDARQQRNDGDQKHPHEGRQ